VVAILALPDVKEKLSGLGFDPVGNTPEEFAVRIKSEIERWGKVIKDAKIKAE
jgi:tripartite-type tricarboxylate transporter receptor subunit TctC